MAAYAALVSVMQIIHQIQDCPFPPISIHTQQLQSLTEIITSLQKFLQGYSSPVADSDRADPLEMRIADAAYAAEDVIESYIVDVIKQAGRSTTTRDDDQETGSGEERRSSSRIQFHEALHQVTEKMGLINKEAMEIFVEKAVVQNDHISSSASASTSSSMMQNSTTVGFDDVLDEVFHKLSTEGTAGFDRRVISITGMSGIGKTTLARNIYEDKVTKKNFNICAWVTVSKTCDSKEILSGILSQASEKEVSKMSVEELRKMSEEEVSKMNEKEVSIMSEEEVSKMSEEDLKSQVHKYLFGRRYLIVLDDIWSVDAWDSTRNYFPENKNGSRVVVTTRSSNLGSELNSNSVKMKLLDETFSWELFTKTVFGERGCPPELEEVGKKISENCRGLPLSIVVVGGFLKKKEHTQQIWRSVLDDLTSTVMLENDEHCLKLLKKSYNHLPVHLKPCFLYLGLFEEDDEISVKTLIRLWVAEGFVRPIHGQSLETIAEGLVKELADRNLIIVDEWGCTENIKSFKMHDLLMDLCSREGQTQRFYHVIRHNGLDHPHGCRRLLIDDTTSNEEAHEALQSMPLVRSIICEENDKVLPCQNLGLLRILNEHTNHMDESDGSPMVFQFVNLRHAIVEVHSNLSITHLWNLQTLIVYAYESLQVPIEIWRMRQLRHIEFVEAQLQHLPDPPVDDEVVVMENLRTLKGVENLKLGEEVIKRIPNIKRLLIENDHTVKGAGDDYYCVSNVERLHKLESLTYQEKHGRVHNLNNLKFPNSIKKLTLRTSYDDDMMGKIGSLPLLQKLKLMSGSFRTGKWTIGKNQFEKLRSLTMFSCDGLKEWAAAEEASSVFRCLERLRLSRLTQLDEIPPAIGDIPTLQSIELSFCSESAVRSAKQIVEEQEELQGEEKVEFHVVVLVDKKHKELKNLATPNFEVEVTELA